MATATPEAVEERARRSTGSMVVSWRGPDGGVLERTCRSGGWQHSGAGEVGAAFIWALGELENSLLKLSNNYIYQLLEFGAQNCVNKFTIDLCRLLIMVA